MPGPCMSWICLVLIDPPVPLFSSLYTHGARNCVGFSADSLRLSKLGSCYLRSKHHPDYHHKLLSVHIIQRDGCRDQSIQQVEYTKLTITYNSKQSCLCASAQTNTSVKKKQLLLENNFLKNHLAKQLLLRL
jgi:hypothetical protein